MAGSRVKSFSSVKQCSLLLHCQIVLIKPDFLSPSLLRHHLTFWRLLNFWMPSTFSLKSFFLQMINSQTDAGKVPVASGESLADLPEFGSFPLCSRCFLSCKQLSAYHFLVFFLRILFLQMNESSGSPTEYSNQSLEILWQFSSHGSLSGEKHS